jgi:hypothetical protein
VLNHGENRGQNDQRRERGADEAADNRAGSTGAAETSARQGGEPKLAGLISRLGRRGLLSRENDQKV